MIAGIIFKVGQADICTNIRGNFRYLPVDCYQQQSSRNTTWFVENVIKYHRMVENYVSTLLDCGFTLEGLKEPKPLASALKERPDLERYTRYAPFLVLKAVKR
ncbi:hypothetical protein VU602_12035 [Providencia stuartii]|uniref:hypothetical protein n=1 Tax=Providencia stuartii TaxID=588 RepID=UPI003CE7B7F2